MSIADSLQSPAIGAEASLRPASATGLAEPGADILFQPSPPQAKEACDSVQITYVTRFCGCHMFRKLAVEEQSARQVNGIFLQMKSRLGIERMVASYDLKSHAFTIGDKLYDMRIVANIKQLLADVQRSRSGAAAAGSSSGAAAAGSSSETEAVGDSSRGAEAAGSSGEVEAAGSSSEAATKELFAGWHSELEKLLKEFLVVEPLYPDQEHALLKECKFTASLTPPNIPVETLRDFGLVEVGSESLSEEGKNMCKKMLLMRVLHSQLYGQYVAECRQCLQEIGRLEANPEGEANWRERLRAKKEESKDLEGKRAQLASLAFIHKMDVLLIAAHAARGNGETSLVKAVSEGGRRWEEVLAGREIALLCETSNIALSLGQRALFARKKGWRRKANFPTTEERGAVTLLSSYFFDMVDPQEASYASKKLQENFVRDSPDGAGVASYVHSDSMMGLLLREIILVPRSESRFDATTDVVLGNFRANRNHVEESAEIPENLSYKKMRNFLMDKKRLNRLNAMLRPPAP